MAATFRTRPLGQLTLAMRPSTRTITTTSRIARPGAAALTKPLQTQQRRGAKTDHQPSIASQRLEAGQLNADLINFQQPNTFISPPLHRHLTQPITLCTLLYQRLWQHGRDALSIIGYGFSVKDGFFGKSPFRPNRSALVPAAKALHATMFDALARGDKPALRRVCVESFATELIGRIEARRSRQNDKYPGLKRQLTAMTLKQRQAGIVGKDASIPLFRWELVKYNKPWAYPRVVDHKIMMLPLNARQIVPIRQAVVAIASRQRLAEIRPAGVADGRIKTEEVEGSAKEVDMLEYITIVATISPDHQTSEWKVLGTHEETTMKSWEEQSKMFKALSAATKTPAKSTPMSPL